MFTFRSSIFQIAHLLLPARQPLQRDRCDASLFSPALSDWRTVAAAVTAMKQIPCSQGRVYVLRHLSSGDGVRPYE